MRDRYASVFMHNVIMDNIPTDKSLVDHIDGNSLDNRKANLRIVSKKQNAKNRKLNKNNKSGYKGIAWREDRNK